MKVFQHLLRRLKYFREPVSTGMSVKVWVAGKKTSVLLRVVSTCTRSSIYAD